jgi:hypothetical protein
MFAFLSCIVWIFINQRLVSFLEIFDCDESAVFTLTLIIISTFSKLRIFEWKMFSVELKCIDSVCHLIRRIFERSFDYKSFSHVLVDFLQCENRFIRRELFLMSLVHVDSISCIIYSFNDLSWLFYKHSLCDSSNEDDQDMSLITFFNCDNQNDRDVFVIRRCIFE